MTEPLMTLAEVKTRLGLDQDSPPDTSQDDLLNQLILAVSAAVEAYTNVVWNTGSPKETQIDFQDGEFQFLTLARRPVIAITSIIDRDESPQVAEPASEFELDVDTGLVWRKAANGKRPAGEVWGKGKRRWQITYSHGYLTVQADVKEAAMRWLQHQQRGEGLKSEKLGDYAYTVGDVGAAETGLSTAPPDDVRLLLAPYVQKGRLNIR